MFGREKKCIVTYTTFFQLDQNKEIPVLKCQISVNLPSHWAPGGQKQERGYFCLWQLSVQHSHILPHLASLAFLQKKYTEVVS